MGEPWMSCGTVVLDGVRYHIGSVDHVELFDFGCKRVELALVPVDYEEDE